MTSKNSGLMVEREGNSIMSKRWKILLINFCQIDKYLEKKLLSGETFLEHKKFDQNVPMLSHFLHFGCIARFMWSFGECIWYCKWSIHCYHCGQYTVTRPIRNNSHLSSSSYIYVLHISLKVINTIHADTLLPGLVTIHSYHCHILSILHSHPFLHHLVNQWEC